MRAGCTLPVVKHVYGSSATRCMDIGTSWKRLVFYDYADTFCMDVSWIVTLYVTFNDPKCQDPILDGIVNLHLSIHIVASRSVVDGNKNIRELNWRVQSTRKKQIFSHWRIRDLPPALEIRSGYYLYTWWIHTTLTCNQSQIHIAYWTHGSSE